MTIQVDRSQWPQVKQEMKAAWKNLNDEDLDETHGDIEEIAKMLQKKYGGNPDLIRKRVARVLNLRSLDEKGQVLPEENKNSQKAKSDLWFDETLLF